MILANTLPWMKWMALLMFYSEKVPILRYTLQHVLYISPQFIRGLSYPLTAPSSAPLPLSARQRSSASHQWPPPDKAPEIS